MSNRTVAIIASVMAAVSFVHDALHVSLSLGPAEPERASVGCATRDALVQLSSDGLRVHLVADGSAVDVLVLVRLPRT